MTLVAKTLPSAWLPPLATGDDSTLDHESRRALAAFRRDFAMRHGDWQLAWARDGGATAAHAGYPYGIGACRCVLATFITTPPPRPVDSSSALVLAIARGRR